MVPREHDQIMISEAFSSMWSSQEKTRYLGEHDIFTSSTTNIHLDKETFHVFTNKFSFI